MLSSILNKPINQRKREWIEDYCLQLAGYAMAHNFIYKTSITKGVVMMCSKDNYYQEFVIEGAELQKYQHELFTKGRSILCTRSVARVDRNLYKAFTNAENEADANRCGRKNGMKKLQSLPMKL
jgi:hypothetical protein